MKRRELGETVMVIGTVTEIVEKANGVFYVVRFTPAICGEVTVPELNVFSAGGVEPYVHTDK